MNLKDRQQRLYVAQQGEKLRKGQISRRTFLKRAAMAGFGLSAASMMRPFMRAQAAAVPFKDPDGMFRPNMQSDMAKWLKDVGGKFKGQTVRIASESTAPSQAISSIMKEQFSDLTGIDVKWEQMPLDQVLSKITQDTATSSASNDVYYLDQSWLGRFVEDTIDPNDYMSKKDSELNMPGFNFDDFLPSLVKYVASYKGRLVGLPYDIPIFIMVYRKDVFDQLKLKPPTTMKEYLDVVKAIDAAKLTNKDGSQIRGTAGQWKSGHYALQCDWTAWLWSHGGSHFGTDSKVTINDEAAQAGAAYMLELGKYQPSGATTWDWSGQGDAITQGLAGIAIHWGEFFPGFDNPDKSKVAGLMETAPLPKEDKLRTDKETSFDETPGIGHQGGSAIALSKYSKVKDAAWIFMQWATSPEITVLASIGGGSADPVRNSTFNDPRVKAQAKVTPGTTRHFPAMLEAINNRMGTEPHYPGWATASSTGGPIPTELGKMTTGAQDIKTSLDNIAKAITESLKE